MWLSVLRENHPFVVSTNDCVGELDDPDYPKACVQESFFEDLQTVVSDYSDPTEDQVAIVTYVKFEDGFSETHLDCDDEKFPEDFRIKCYDVDRVGFIAQYTYQEAIVGSEEYGYSEHAILVFQLNGLEVDVSPPTFTQSLSRTWLYKFNADEQEHELDFSGSSSFVWDYPKGANQKTIIKKTISMRVDDALAIELYKKTIDGVEVVVRLEGIDAWNDITLTIPQDSKLPANGQQFSTADLNFEVSIEDISPQCSIQYTILTEVSPEIEEQIETYGEDDNWADEWEHIGSDYIIQSYKIA